MKGVFVTGTDTGVGKTLVTCALLSLLAQKTEGAAGMKPIATGAIFEGGEWCSGDTVSIMDASSISLPVSLVTPCLMRAPVSPDIAARMEGRQIDLEYVYGCYRQICEKTAAVVVEGVGGFRVPLSETQDASDLAVQLGLPVVLVVGLRLGCMSVAMLTVEAILSRGLTLAGWVANHIDPHLLYTGEVITSLDARIPAERLGTIPYMPSPSWQVAAQFIDLLPPCVR
ncbi:MAG: dethiobiotin synthase [Burkholderiaceae bacterium]|jgi:dethiobiotin synthetase|nr:dethiobiotin synthase [Burkholderiaceae bacterium]